VSDPRYSPAKGFFDPNDLAVMDQALRNTWALIQGTDVLDLPKTEALRRALCLKLLAITSAKPTDAKLLSAALLDSVREDPPAADAAPD